MNGDGSSRADLIISGAHQILKPSEAIANRTDRSFLYPSTIIHYEDLQRAGTMHTFHAAELDIAGGRWPRDEGDGMRCPLRQTRDGLGDQPYHLFCSHDTQMPIGDQ